jgi:hypothetical protein
MGRIHHDDDDGFVSVLKTVGIIFMLLDPAFECGQVDRKDAVFPRISMH